MKITINNKEINVACDAVISVALAEAGVATNGIAVAVNGAVVPTSKYNSHVLKEGDSLTVIKAFYGG